MKSLGLRMIASDPGCWILLTDESDEQFIKRCGGHIEDYPEFKDSKAAAEYQEKKKLERRRAVIS